MDLNPLDFQWDWKRQRYNSVRKLSAFLAENQIITTNKWRNSFEFFSWICRWLGIFPSCIVEFGSYWDPEICFILFSIFLAPKGGAIFLQIDAKFDENVKNCPCICFICCCCDCCWRKSVKSHKYKTNIVISLVLFPIRSLFNLWTAFRTWYISFFCCIFILFICCFIWANICLRNF